MIADDFLRNTISEMGRMASEGECERVEREAALGLFHAAAKRVPAYADFLRSQGVNPASIQTWEDFGAIPPVTKDNYLRKYSLPELCWDGTMADTTLIFTSTSGSTGQPFYFPRSKKLDKQFATIIADYLSYSPYSDGPTLVLVGFGLGVWIGGIITYQAFEIAGEVLDHPVSILTTGNNKDEIFHALRNIAPLFKQVILVGYPPFIKDVVDEASSRGVDLRSIQLRFVFAAEAFSKEFRQYLLEKTGVQNGYLNTMNIYGSADIGAMAFETPVSIFARDISLEHRPVFEQLFSNIAKTPTLAQYNPAFIHFETIDRKIHLTGDNYIPLIRYSLGDHGGILTYNQVTDAYRAHGVDFDTEIEKAGIAHTVKPFPFVYVYERYDFSVKLFGATLFPEHIKMALLDDEVSHAVTGKFTMETVNDIEKNQYLSIHVELNPHVEGGDALLRQLADVIVRYLLQYNSEYANMRQMVPERAHPRLTLWPHASEPYFRPGIKQKWVLK